MFPERKNIDREVKALFDATRSETYGQFFSHEFIGKASSIPHGDKHYGKLIRKWKRLMAAGGKWIRLATPAGTGYCVCTKQEALYSQPDRYTRSARRLIDLAASAIACTPENDLTPDERSIRVAHLHQKALMKKQIQTDRAELTGWVSNPETLPQQVRRPKIAG
jgi:hypothetical protein